MAENTYSTTSAPSVSRGITFWHCTHWAPIWDSYLKHSDMPYELSLSCRPCLQFWQQLPVVTTCLPAHLVFCLLLGKTLLWDREDLMGKGKRLQHTITYLLRSCAQSIHVLVDRTSTAFYYPFTLLLFLLVFSMSIVSSITHTWDRQAVSFYTPTFTHPT